MRRANSTVRRSMCGGARYYELCGALIRRVQPGAALMADDLELRTQDRQPNDRAEGQIGRRRAPPRKGLLLLDLLLVAAHVASRFFVHRMLLLIAAASRAGHRRGQMSRYVRGAPPGDQPIATRFCAVAEAHLWYVIAGRPFTP
jgi:hypothetical protein